MQALYSSVCANRSSKKDVFVVVKYFSSVYFVNNVSVSYPTAFLLLHVIINSCIL